ncbi:MAG: hypothetical protein H7287_06230, partial [Thermoleophilia bacterium]|nr:hypothetical protein [Thermoleophilia bacterium]
MRSIPSIILVVIAATLLAFVAAPTSAAPRTVTIYGTVGPGFAITLK